MQYHSSSGLFPIKKINILCFGLEVPKKGRISKLCGSGTPARNSPCVLFVKTLSPWISSLTLFMGVCRSVENRGW